MEPTPGVKTTEFWTTLLTTLLGAAVSFASLFGVALSSDKLQAIVPAISMLAVAIVNAAYHTSRANVKAAAMQATVALNTPAPAVVAHGTVNVVPSVQPNPVQPVPGQ